MRADPNGSDSPPNARLAPWQENPYRLVSLWEIMRSVNITELMAMRSILQLAQSSLKLDRPALIDLSTREQIKALSSLMADAASGYRFPCTMVAMQRLVSLADDGQATNADAAKLAEDVAQRLVDEAENTVFLHLPEQASQLFLTSNPFGELVSSRFREARDDIEEAAKCLALDRGTACVMHLMRAVEAALSLLSRASRVKTLANHSENNWNHRLHPLKQMLENMAGNKRVRGRGSLTVKQNYAMLSQAHAMLNAVRVAWRNPTMHVERVYSPSEAEGVFHSVRALMVFLAENIDEQGQLRPMECHERA